MNAIASSGGVASARGVSAAPDVLGVPRQDYTTQIHIKVGEAKSHFVAAARDQLKVRLRVLAWAARNAGIPPFGAGVPLVLTGETWVIGDLPEAVSPCIVCEGGHILKLVVHGLQYAS